MDNKEKLEVQIRQLRLRVLDLESSVKNLTNRKQAILADISLLEDKRNKAIISLKDIEQKIGVSGKELLQKKSDSAELDDNMAQSMATVQKHMDDVLLLKENLENETIKMADERKRYAMLSEEVLNERQSLRLLDEKHRDMIKELKDKVVEHNNLIKLTNAYKSELDEYANTLSSRERAISDSEKAIDEIRVIIGIDRETQQDLKKQLYLEVEQAKENNSILVRQQKIAEDKIKECDIKSKSLSAQISALDERDNEIELKRLRVEKLINQHKLEDEIKKLEQSLK